MLDGLVPRAEIVTDPAMLYLAIGILGATVMPHNLYLHSSIVQTRDFQPTDAGKREAMRFATIDIVVALTLAIFVNASILVLAASTFHAAGMTEVVGIEEAYRLLTPALGVGAAGTLFAVALLASGHNASVTGTMAGQIVMEGLYPVPLAGVGAPARGPPARHGSSAVRRDGLWRGGGDAAPHPEPGRAEPAVALRRLSPRASDGQQGSDGQVRQRSAHRGRRLGDDSRPDRAERRAARGNDDIAQRITRQMLNPA